MSITVFFWLMRHGEKTGRTNDELSDFGRDQVRASAVAHLPQTGIDVLVHSGTKRTEVSAEIIASVVPVLSGPYEQRALGFKGLYDDKHLPSYDFLKIEDTLNQKYGAENVTAYHWLAACPPAWGARRGLQLWMLESYERVLRHSQLKETDVFHFVGTSHDPICALAALRPREIPALGTADILRYEVGVNREGRLEIGQPFLLPCPLQQPRG